MSEPRKVFDGETVIETARVEFSAIGTGCIIIATLVDDEGTAILADSAFFPDWDFDTVKASEMASDLLHDMRLRLDSTVPYRGSEEDR